MIIAHAVVGLLPINDNSFSWFWFWGSVAPDIDHLFVLAKHNIFRWRKIADSMRHEKKYHIHYRTKLFHSILGAVIMSAPLAFISVVGALYFFSAYLVHLLLDWPDIGEKHYLYPLKIKFKGFLPVFSWTEKIFTAFLFLTYLYTIAG